MISMRDLLDGVFFLHFSLALSETILPTVEKRDWNTPFRRSPVISILLITVPLHDIQSINFGSIPSCDNLGLTGVGAPAASYYA